SNPEEYFNKIKTLKIENEVKVINQFIPNEDVEKYYKISDLVILPYRSATQSAVLTIAYGFSKPVVATNVGGLAEFVEDKITGIIVEPNSSSALANGIKKFFSLKDTIDFKTNVQNYISQNEFEKLPQLFLEILNDSN
ncbi:MAG: glycosyltransferase, partial [Ignavibacteriaceae bacterium]